MEKQASLELCNLIASGKTREEAEAILGFKDSPPVATVGTETAPVGTGATGGSTPPLDPPTVPTIEGEKPSWMP